MALFKIRRGLQASYDALTSYNDGHLYVCTDTGNVYAATSDTNSVQLCINAKTLNGKEKFVEVVTTGTVNGTILVDGVSVPVAGLKSAAFTEASEYATAAQGAKADSAVQPGVLSSTLESYLLKADKYNDSEVRGLISDNAEAIEGLQETVKNIQENAYDDTELKNLINSVKETAEAAPTVTEVDGQIDTKIAALNLATTYEPIGEAQRVVNALNLATTYATKEESAQVLVDAKAYTDEMKDTILGGEGLKETFDTLLEIQNWIEGDGVNATELAEAIAKETKDREDADKAINEEIAKCAKSADLGDLAGKDEADLNLGQYAKSADISEDIAKGVAAKESIDANKATWDKAGTAVQPGQLGDLASKNESSLNLGQYAKSVDLGDLAAKDEADLDLKELAHKTEADLGLGELAKMDLSELGLDNYVKSADLATVLVDLMGWGSF